MQDDHPNFDSPAFLESPLPILTLRHSLLKVHVNTCMLLIYAVKDWNDSGRQRHSHVHFPWLLLSVIFSASLMLIDNPKFKEFKSIIPGNFFPILLSMRVVLVGLSLRTAAGLQNFVHVEFIALDVSSMWCGVVWCGVVVV